MSSDEFEEDSGELIIDDADEDEDEPRKEGFESLARLQEAWLSRQKHLEAFERDIQVPVSPNNKTHRKLFGILVRVILKTPPMLL